MRHHLPSASPTTSGQNALPRLRFDAFESDQAQVLTACWPDVGVDARPGRTSATPVPPMRAVSSTSAAATTTARRISVQQIVIDDLEACLTGARIGRSPELH